MAGVQQGRIELLETLIDRYQGPLFGYAFRVLSQREAAEDAVQESFLKVFRCRLQYRQGASFKAWLYQICLNVCRDALRRGKRRPTVELEEVPSSGHEDHVIAAQRVREALRQIPDKQREVFLLVEYQGLSYQEAADTLQVPIGTIKSRMFHATRALAGLLKT